MKVLVTGGAGYIGSQLLLDLLDRGHSAVVVDDLSTGSRGAVPSGVLLIRSDLRDSHELTRTLKDHGISAIMHLAAKIAVAESFARPLDYFDTNTACTINVLRAAVDAGIQALVFSSTAAVYGIPDVCPVSECAETRPISPYGRSKLISEWLLRDVAAAHGLRWIVLRYFNVAGADPNGRAGSRNKAATALIKLAIDAALGKRPYIEIFGTDFSTRDGTGVRDYIHVSDLAGAHIAALDHLHNGGDSQVLNCGYGKGYSVREIVSAVQRVSGRSFEVRHGPRREGDAAEVIANPDRIKQTLNWTPRYDDLDTIVAHGLLWQRKLLGVTIG